MGPRQTVCAAVALLAPIVWAGAARAEPPAIADATQGSQTAAAVQTPPFVVIGNAGGRMRGGRYVEYPYLGNPGHREIGNLCTTLLQAAGETRPYFGVRDPNLKGIGADGPLPEPLA